jgi:hypothetical protein
MGYPSISPWEFILLPDDDIRDIEAYIHYSKQFSAIAQRRAERKAKKEKNG